MGCSNSIVSYVFECHFFDLELQIQGFKQKQIWLNIGKNIGTPVEISSSSSVFFYNALLTLYETIIL